MTPRKPKVHKGTYWEGNHAGDGFYLPLCGATGFSYETRWMPRHVTRIAGYTDAHRIDCKRCLKLMNKQTQGNRG